MSSTLVLLLAILQRLAIMHRLTFRFKTHWQFKYCSACLSVKTQVNKDPSSGNCSLQTLSHWFPTPSPVGFCWAWAENQAAAPFPWIQIQLPFFLHLFHVPFCSHPLLLIWIGIPFSACSFIKLLRYLLPSFHTLTRHFTLGRRPPLTWYITKCHRKTEPSVSNELLVESLSK